MVRGKNVMKTIENAASRLVTFSRRRSGLLKKAFELSVLCDAEAAVVIFSQKGRLYEFSSSNVSVQKTIERYHMHTKEIPTHKPEMEQHMQVQLYKEKIRQLKAKERMLFDENAKLCKMCGDGKPWQQPLTQQRRAVNNCSQNSQ